MHSCADCKLCAASTLVTTSTSRIANMRQTKSKCTAAGAHMVIISTLEDFELLVAFQFSLRSLTAAAWQACSRAAWCYTCCTIAPGTPRCAPRKPPRPKRVTKLISDYFCLRLRRLQVQEHVPQPMGTMSKRNTQVHRCINASHTVEMVSAAEVRSMG